MADVDTDIALLRLAWRFFPSGRPTIEFLLLMDPTA